MVDMIKHGKAQFWTLCSSGRWGGVGEDEKYAISFDVLDPPENMDGNVKRHSFFIDEASLTELHRTVHSRGSGVAQDDSVIVGVETKLRGGDDKMGTAHTPEVPGRIDSLVTHIENQVADLFGRLESVLRASGAPPTDTENAAVESPLAERLAKVENSIAEIFDRLEI